MKKIYFSLFILLLVFVPSFLVDAKKAPVIVYEFYGDGCPHCQHSFEWFESIEEEYGDYFDLQKYEVWYNDSNSQLMSEVADLLGDSVNGVPYIVIGENSVLGFGNSSKEKILNYIMDEYNKTETKRYQAVSKLVSSSNEDIEVDSDNINDSSNNINFSSSLSFSSIILSLINIIFGFLFS